MAIVVMAGPLKLGNGAAAAQTAPSSPASTPSSFPSVDPQAPSGKAPPEVKVPIPDVTAVGKPPMPPAAKPGEELLDRRTAASKTFVGEEPGQLRTTVFQAPVHFKDPQGRWVDIDDALGAPRDGRRRNGANVFGLSIAERSTDKALARLDIDDKHSVGFALDGAAEVKAKGDAKSVTYAKVHKDTDVRLTSLHSGVKEELVLASPAAPDRFLFPLELKGLTASLDDAGNVIYRDGAGVERARTPHGFMTDARIDPRSGESEMSLGVDYALIPWKGGTALEVRLDRAWLDDPARQYPVTVDPDIHHAAWGDDTYVMSGFYRDNSYDAELKVGTYDGGYHIGRSFVRFDTAAFAGATVQHAEMHLAERHSWNCGYWPEPAYRVTGGWNGRNMPDWSNQPPVDPNGVGGTWEGTICGSRTAKWNVTGMAATWAAAGQPEASVSLRATNESDNNRWKKYASTEAGAPPALHVWYNRPPAVPYNVTPANGAVVGTPSTPVSAVYSDPDGNSGYLAFGVWNYHNQLVWSQWSGLLCSGCGTTLAVPALPDNWYYVMVIGHDGAQYSSAWSPQQWYFIDTLPPAASELTPLNGASGSSPTQVSARYSEPYGFTGYMYFWLYTTAGVRIVENWSAITNPGAVASLAIPNLAPGTYNLWAMPWDTRQTGPQIGPNTFTVGVPPTTTTVAPTTTTTVPATTTTVPATTTTVPANTTTTTAPLPTTTTAPTTSSTSIPMARPTPVESVGAFAESSRTVRVNWTPSPDTQGVTGYRITTAPACSSCGGLTVSGTTNSSIVTGLRPGTEYVFRVIATNPGGNSDPSPVTDSSRATTFGEAPDAPTGVTAIAGHGEVTVSWTPPEELNGARLLGYNVIVSPECPSCGGRFVEAPSSRTVVTGLTNAQQYTFTVEVTSDQGPVTSTEFATATPIPVLRVMTWNIQRGLTGSEDWFSDGDPGRFADEIAEQRADVVVFQEITKGQAEAIAVQLGWAWSPSQWVQTKDPASEWIGAFDRGCIEQVHLRCRQQGNAIISRYALEDIADWPLPAAPNEQADEERSYQRAVVTLEGGFRVHLYNTHLASGDQNGDARDLQARAILDRIVADRSGESGFRAVLAGDLNAEPHEQPIPILSETMQDAWTGPGGETSSPDNPTKRIDYIMVDKASGVPINSARVGTTIGLSDHHWVSADL